MSNLTDLVITFSVLFAYVQVSRFFEHRKIRLAFRNEQNPEARKKLFVKMIRGDYSKEVIDAIEHGADVNAKDSKGYTPLMEAAYKGNSKIVGILLKAGADVNAKNDSGATALLLASWHYDNVKVTDMLVSAGAEIDAKDEEGRTALMRAAGCSSVDVVKLLIDAGADVHARNNNGVTVLMFAERPENIRLLLDAGVDINAVDNNGANALIYAARSDSSETLNALMDAGINVKQKDNKGKTALDYAKESWELEDTDALKRLEELSRQINPKGGIINNGKSYRTQQYFLSRKRRNRKHPRRPQGTRKIQSVRVH